MWYNGDCYTLKSMLLRNLHIFFIFSLLLGYFCDVLDDLGLTPSTELQNLLALLKAKPEAFDKVAKGKSHLLVRKVTLMRRLKWKIFNLSLSWMYSYLLMNIVIKYIFIKHVTFCLLKIFAIYLIRSLFFPVLWLYFF